MQKAIPIMVICFAGVGLVELFGSRKNPMLFSSIPSGLFICCIGRVYHTNFIQMSSLFLDLCFSG